MTAPVVVPNRAERRARGVEPTGHTYPGHWRDEADGVYRMAQERGLPLSYARILACLASLGRLSWVFQATIAKYLGVSVRSIQRAVRRGKKFGILVSRRIRRGERTPSGTRLDCGGALRRFVAWGLPLAQAAARCIQYAIRWEWRQAAIERREERDRSEAQAAVAEFRERGPT